MQSRIIEIATNGRYLHMYRGFLVIEDKGEEIGRVALDDIAAVIANAHGLIYSNNLLVELAKRSIPFVLCGDNHKPEGMVWPVDGHHLQAGRFDAQIAMKSTTKARLWKQIVQAKVQHQANILDRIEAPSAPIRTLIKKVKSGDTTNIEAQAAAKYWKLLMGPDFRRDQSQAGLNSMLNYGYTILRAATARAVIAAGLHPTIGLHHQNQGNSMRLVDDLMEPFRPLIDFQVWTELKAQNETLCADTKANLAQSLYQDCLSEDGKTPAFLCLQKLATSLAHTALGERETLSIASII